MKFLMMIVGFIVSTVVFAVPVFAQERPEAAVAPIAVVGDISEAQKQIIFTSFLTELSAHYNIISQEQFKAAQDQAFGELEAAQCTEEQCIRRIQEILQVERLFVLQMVKEGQDTQLGITLIDLEKKLVKSDYCENCDTKTLNQRIARLVSSLVGQPALAPQPLTQTASSGVGQIFLRSKPNGATIFLDGNPLDKQTDSVLENIPAGEHTLFLQKDNLSKTQTLTLKPNQLLTLELELERTQTTLFINSEPFNADAYLDDKLLGKTPIQTETAVGEHLVEFKLSGYFTEQRSVSLAAGVLNKINVVLVSGSTTKLVELTPKLARLAELIEAQKGTSTQAGNLLGEYLKYIDNELLKQHLTLSTQGVFNLGSIYYKGYGVEINYGEAFYWYKKSAESGHAPAQSQVGFMLRKGEGIAPDEKQAVLWYQKAAAQGHANAQFNLGSMYRKGYGVSQDVEKAKELYRQAAKNGNTHAAKVLDWME